MKYKTGEELDRAFEFFIHRTLIITSKTFVSNGCGPDSGTWSIFTKLIPNLIYLDACKDHDLDYEIGFPILREFYYSPDYVRNTRDRKFLINMIKRVERKNYFLGSVKKIRDFYKLCANKYFDAVLQGGKRSFKANETPKTWLERISRSDYLYSCDGKNFKPLISIFCE